MARRRVERPPAARGLSTRAAISAMRVIELALNSFEATAPQAVAAIGGRSGIQARFDGMAVGESGSSVGILGPVPRLTVEEWEQMSWEYVDSLSPYGATNPGKACSQPNPWAGEAPSPAPVRGLGYGGAL